MTILQKLVFDVCNDLELEEGEDGMPLKALHNLSYLLDVISSSKGCKSAKGDSILVFSSRTSDSLLQQWSLLVVFLHNCLASSLALFVVQC